ncbi:hypothetical protein ACFXTO_043837 [Malus domestica]
MSSPVPDNVFVSQLFRFVLSWYDAVLAVSLACAIVHPVFNFTFTSSSISKLCDAPAIKVSNLRSILPLDQSDKLVVVRGTVEAKFAVDSTWTSLKSGHILDLSDEALPPPAIRGLLFGFLQILWSTEIGYLNGPEVTCAVLSGGSHMRWYEGEGEGDQEESEVAQRVVEEPGGAFSDRF